MGSVTGRPYILPLYAAAVASLGVKCIIVLAVGFILVIVCVQKRLYCCPVVDVATVNRLGAVPPAHNVELHAHVL
jgi:hypothetical protein